MNKLTFLLKRVLILIGICCLFQSVNAQKGDFELWLTASQRVSLIKDLKLKLTEESRFYQNASSLRQLFIAPALEYEVNQYFSVAAAYKLRQKYEYKVASKTDHTFYFDANAEYKLHRLTFSERTRYETSSEEIKDDVNNSENIAYWRQKVEVDYDIYRLPVTPSISAEYYFPIENNIPRYADKLRMFIGADYEYFRHKFGIAYGINHSRIKDQRNKYILNISYTHKF
jgi:hypothetical protein